jgi:hypothetical protein
MTGPVRGDLPPQQSISLPPRALSGIQFRNGDIVDVRVIQPLAGDRWQLSIGGKLIPAKVEIPVQPGIILSVRIMKLPNGGLVLRLLDRSPATGLAARLGFPATADVQLIISALIRSGMPVQSEHVSELLAMLSRLKKKDSSAARLLAMLHDRGIRLTSAQIDLLLQEIGDGSATPDRPGYGHQGERRPGDSPQDRNARESKRTVNQIASMIRRFTTGAESMDRSLLQVFNHIPAGHDHWVVIPFGYSANEDHVRGSIRVRLRSRGSRVFADRYALSANVEGEQWVFCWAGGGEKRSIGVYTDCELGSHDRRRLESTLSDIGYRLTSGVQPLSATDGFSDLDDGRYSRGVERMV